MIDGFLSHATASPGTSDVRLASGPYFDELTVGDVFDEVPSVTLTAGMQAVHQSIVGHRMRLSLDTTLASAVCGTPALAFPGLVWDLAIGQSSIVTQHVKANLFYRGLAFQRFPGLGDTLRTTVSVLGLRENSRRPGRAPTGLAVLRVRTRDQQDRAVLDFVRCAMLPLSGPDVHTDWNDDVRAISYDASDPVADPCEGWDIAAFVRGVGGSSLDDLAVGRVWHVFGGDVVSSAPELARLTMNVAATHHDHRVDGRQRLVYGGHTIGIALLQTSRAVPGLVVVTRWERCDHLGPVYEGDVLTTTVTVKEICVRASGGAIVQFNATVQADGPGGECRDVLSWTFDALVA